MSLGRRCDNCNKPIEDSDASDKPIDCLILFDGEIFKEYEDLCPDCRKKIKDFLSNKFNLRQPNNIQQIKMINKPKAENAIQQKDKGIQQVKQEEQPKIDSANNEIKVENTKSEYIPFSGAKEDDLADGVVKRWSLPEVKHKN